MNAAAQNFNSLGIAFGSVMSFSSYNRFNNQILVDTLAVSTINGFTSILVGIFAFATIGNIASEHGTAIESVVSDGEYEILLHIPLKSAFLELLHFHLHHYVNIKQFAVKLLNQISIH